MSVKSSPRLFIGGLKTNLEKEELIDEFKEFGEITDIWIAYDPPGFAFIEYPTAENAQAALEAKHRTICFGTEIRVEYTKKKGDVKERAEDEPRPRLFIGNIKTAIEKEDLMTIFEPFGAVTDVWIAHNPPGFAFVEFEDMTVANKAVEERDGKEYFGGPLKVQITKGKREGRRNRMGMRAERGRNRGGGYPPRRSPYDMPPDPYRRRLPPPSRYARDPYARDPYARDPYARDPYYADPYARDPYYPRDPYARRPEYEYDYSPPPIRRRPPPPRPVEPYPAEAYATDYTADYVEASRARKEDPYAAADPYAAVAAAPLAPY